MVVIRWSLLTSQYRQYDRLILAPRDDRPGRSRDEATPRDEALVLQQVAWCLSNGCFREKKHTLAEDVCNLTVPKLTFNKHQQTLNKPWTKPRISINIPHLDITHVNMLQGSCHVNARHLFLDVFGVWAQRIPTDHCLKSRGGFHSPAGYPP